jgi:hypothetical protein
MAMRADFPALLMALAFMALAPQVQAAACHCKARTHTSDRSLHRPSTEEEHAQTARLNREYLAAVRSAMRETPKTTAYQSELDQYRQLREGYDRRLRDYYRAVPPRGQSFAQTPPPPVPAHADERYGQEAARLDPWHGYNSRGGLANGY